MRKTIGLPPASVVLPTWNAASFVRRVLPALLAQDLPEFEVLIVDNGVVNAETEEAVKEFASGRLRYLRFEKQLGYAGAVNEGTKAARYPLVAVINNDNLAEPGWLSALVAAHERLLSSGREAIVSSLVDRPDFPFPLDSRINFCGRTVRVPSSGPGGYIPFHPDGSAFLFNRDVFGLPYDESFFIYHEDTYLGWRAWLLGHEVALAEDSRASTFDGGSTRRIAYRTAYFTERNRWLNFFLFPGRSVLARWLPLLLADAMLKFVAGTNRKAKFHAWLSLARDWREISGKRRSMQSQRRRPDSEILRGISGSYLSQGKAGAWLLNGLFGAWISVWRIPFGR